MSTTPTFEKTEKKPVGINEMLAAVRNIESGSYEGDYALYGPRFNGRSYYGAYQIATDYWPQWAALAGIEGADMRSPQAQDRVASYVMNEYYIRYGSWDLAAMAWLAGPQEAAKVLRRGYTDLTSILNPKIREYVQSVSDAAQYAVTHPEEAITRQIPSVQFAEAHPGNGWVNPVAGASEYSNSFMVPRPGSKTGIHGAIDVYAEKGTPIVSPVPGKVLSTKKSDIGGYTTRIQGDDGVIYYFAHMDGAAVVGAGQRVQAGHHIGYVGDSGNAAGTTPHLHLKMTVNGRIINPFSYLEQASSLGISNQIDAQEISMDTPTGGTTGTMNSWLQSMSDGVRAGAPAMTPEEAVAEPDEVELSSGKMVPI